jgi:sulfonate transport system substrate-binding protein
MRKIVMTLLLMAACGRAVPEHKGAATLVRIGYQKIGAPLLLRARGSAVTERLRARGASIEWLEFQTGPMLLEAMRANAVDLGYVGEAPPVFAQAGGVPFVYVGVDPPAPRSEGIVVPKDSPLHSLRDLRGKRLALNRGSNVHYLVVRALESAGLALPDVQITFLAPADARTAFDSGQVDAWAIWDPFYAAAELAGARTLADGTGLVDNHQFYVARSDFAADSGELLRVVLDGFAELSAWAAEHPEDAARVTAAASGIEYEALLRTEHRHAYGLQPIDSEILRGQQRIADAFLKLQIVPRTIETKSAYLAAANFKPQ